MTDFFLLEQLHGRMKESAKPRLAFRKGISAGGFFRPYMSMPEYTKASIFRSLDEITPVTVRFSAMLGDRGTADTVRNIKGMDVKFRAEEKDHDMMCRSLPVSFISDRTKLLHMMDAFSQYQSFDGRCAGKFWEFVTENPEAVHCALRFFSWQGISDSFVDMTWYSVNTSTWENARGRKFFVRYRWVPVGDDEEKRRSIDRNAAEFMAGYEPDRAVNELKRRIAQGSFPTYQLQVQMRCDTPQQDDEDLTERSSRTLLWDEARHPYMAAGLMKLTRLSEDYRRDCDLLSFSPYNTIDGMEASRDDFTDIMDYICRIEAAERGAAL